MRCYWKSNNDTELRWDFFFFVLGSKILNEQPMAGSEADNEQETGFLTKIKKAIFGWIASIYFIKRIVSFFLIIDNMFIYILWCKILK